MATTTLDWRWVVHN